MYPKSALLCVLAVGAVAPAIAGQSSKAIGVGASPCNDYLAAAKADARKDVYVQWVSGMITGVAALTTKLDPQGLTVGSLAVDLKRYCTDHTSQTIFEAASALAQPYRVAKPYPLSGG
jgi:hypothetical protein